MTVLSGGPLLWFCLHTFWELSFNVINGDILDGHWYNNPDAIGNQLYPTGIHKYYDMYSFTGLIDFSWQWLIVFAADLASPITLFIPLDIFFAIFFYKWDGMEKWFLYYVPWGLGLNTLYGVYFD